MLPSEPLEENEHFHASSVTLTDEAGRTLACYVERSLFLEDKEYVLLLPVDSAIEIFALQGDGDEEEVIPVEDEATIDKIFTTAEAVLAEQNLALKRTAFFDLMVSGDLPDVEDEDAELFVLESEEEGVDLEPEQLQFLANFYHEEQEYTICTPLDPPLFFARMNAAGTPEFLSAEEIAKVQPMLEEQLFDELE